mmetsp:Transcript_2243/g.7460  ORF Transcript_2243/g.7460 Transcript_2243/m.7460 type:complete len:312 (-) Transcript_2243:507-1442(-)
MRSHRSRRQRVDDVLQEQPGKPHGVRGSADRALCRVVTAYSGEAHRHLAQQASQVARGQIVAHHAVAEVARRHQHLLRRQQRQRVCEASQRRPGRSVRAHRCGPRQRLQDIQLHGRISQHLGDAGARRLAHGDGRSVVDQAPTKQHAPTRCRHCAWPPSQARPGSRWTKLPAKSASVGQLTGRVARGAVHAALKWPTSRRGALPRKPRRAAAPRPRRCTGVDRGGVAAGRVAAGATSVCGVCACGRRNGAFGVLDGGAGAAVAVARGWVVGTTLCAVARVRCLGTGATRTPGTMWTTGTGVMISRHARSRL